MIQASDGIRSMLIRRVTAGVLVFGLALFLGIEIASAAEIVAVFG
ncbi:MAG: hypothetical protein ABIS67_10005 [Candidatus Eisenbacteria bacterium]